METWFLKDEAVFNRFIASLKAIQWPLIINVKKPKKKRSLDQNALYWSWLHIISPHTGYSPDDLHDVLKVKFLGVREMQFRGETYLLAKSTTALTTAEFKAYLDKVYILATELNVKLPQPDYWGFE